MRAVSVTCRLGVGAIVALVLLGGVSGALARPRIQVLEQGPDRTVVHLRWEAGSNEAQTARLVIALPSNRLPQLRVDERRSEPAARREGLPQVSSDRELVELGPPVRVRGVWRVVATVRLHYLDQQGRPLRLRGLRLDFEHPALAGEFLPPPADWAMDPARHLPTAGLINPEAARAFRRAQVAQLESAAKRAPGQEDTFARSPRWLRLEISETGLYRVRFEDLEAVLLSEASSIDPATLRLFASPHLLQSIDPNVGEQSWESDYGLVERPLLVRAAQPLVGMGPGDEFLFYNGGIDTWLDRHDPSAASFDHIEHEYADRLALWLCWERVGEDDTSFDDPPLRMEESGAPPSVDGEVSTCRERVHREDAKAMRYGIVQDNWTQTAIPLQEGEAERLQWAADHVVDADGRLYVNPVTLWVSGTPRVQVLSNGHDLGTFTWSFNQQVWNSEPIRFGMSMPAPVEGLNEIQVVNRSTGTRIDLDLVDLSYRRRLFVRGGRLEWMIFPDEYTSPVGRTFVVGDDETASTGFEDGTVVLDTSDPLHPVRLTAVTVDNGGLSLRIETLARPNLHLAVYQPRGVRQPLALSLADPRHLRSEVFQQGGWDYVVVGPSELLDGVGDLADFHRMELDDGAGDPLVAPRVGVVDLQDVWDSFGYGVKEPAALRNFLKFSYLHEVAGESGRQTEYVLLVGDASRDYRSRLPSSIGEQERDRCPTYIQTHWPHSNSFYSRGGEKWVPFPSDDWLGAFDAPDSSNTEGLAPYDLAELAIGRLPVANAAEARMVARRLVEYQRSPADGTWRNDILLVCDDEVSLASGSTTESFHIDQGERLAEEYVPPVLDVNKLYLTEYPNPPGPRNKPAARAEMKRQWSAGKLIVHYIGHGSPKQMADEKVFLIEDVGTLTNEDRLPLMMALSCDVSIFDSPTEKSMSEQLVLHSGGGAIATIAATQVTFVGSNNSLTDELYEWLFPSDDPADTPPVGAVLRSARAGLGGSAFTDNNSRKYVLFGDPALSLAAPGLGLQVSGAFADSIQTGVLGNVAALTADGHPFSGRYRVRLEEARDHSGYSRVDNDTTIFHIDYVLDGASFFRGEGSVVGDTLRVEAPAPVALRPGLDGRVRILYSPDLDPHGMLSGYAEPVPVVLRATDSDDLDGPQIQLAFSSPSPVVIPGDTLVAVLSDPSGINVLGNSPASRINLDFDDSDFPLDVTSLFHLDDGRYDRGSLAYALPGDLDPGDHTMILSASDTRGNLSTATISFTLQAAGSLEIRDALAVPSPFSDATRFVVDLTDAAAVEIQIYSLDGRVIRRLKGVQPRRGVLVIEWDGLDFRGDEIANGAYLYTVRATFLQTSTQSLTLSRTGRVVKMR